MSNVIESVDDFYEMAREYQMPPLAIGKALIENRLPCQSCNETGTVTMAKRHALLGLEMLQEMLIHSDEECKCPRCLGRGVVVLRPSESITVLFHLADVYPSIRFHPDCMR